MTIDILNKPLGTVAFPKFEVEARLRKAFLSSIEGTMRRGGIELPSSLELQSVAHVHLDSLDVVTMLCDVEPVVGIELKESIVKSGGYYSVNEAIGEILPRIEAAWQKRFERGIKK